MIITSSIAKKLDAERLYPQKRVVLQKLELNTIEGACTYVQNMVHRPKVVVLFIGGNDPCSTPAEPIAKKLSTLIAEIHARVAGVQVVVSEVMPRDDTENMFSENVHEYNNIVRAMCVSSQILHFMEQTNLHGHWIRYDHVHIKDKYIGLLAINVKKSVHPLLGMGPYGAPRTSRRGHQGRGAAGGGVPA